MYSDCHAPINVKPAGVGGRRGIGQGFYRLLWCGGRAFELSCCPGGREYPANIRPQIISVIFDLTFLPGGKEFYSNFFGKCQIPALCTASRPTTGLHLQLQ